MQCILLDYTPLLCLYVHGQGIIQVGVVCTCIWFYKNSTTYLGPSGIFSTATFSRGAVGTCKVVYNFGRFLNVQFIHVKSMCHTADIFIEYIGSAAFHWSRVSNYRGYFNLLKPFLISHVATNLHQTVPKVSFKTIKR